MSKTIVRRLYCDAAEIAAGFQLLTPEDVTSVLQDGRALSWFGQKIAAKIYKQIEAPTNQKGFDLTGSVDTQTEVKCLTDSVAFHASSNSGKNRTCTEENVRDYILNVATFIVVDITKFPVIDFISINGSRVMNWHQTGKISLKRGEAGYKRFYKALGEIEIVTIIPEALPLCCHGIREPKEVESTTAVQSIPVADDAQLIETPDPATDQVVLAP